MQGRTGRDPGNLFSHQRSFLGDEIMLEGQCALEDQTPWCEFRSDSVISLKLQNIYISTSSGVLIKALQWYQWCIQQGWISQSEQIVTMTHFSSLFAYPSSQRTPLKGLIENASNVTMETQGFRNCCFDKAPSSLTQSGFKSLGWKSPVVSVKSIKFRIVITLQSRTSSRNRTRVKTHTKEFCF